VPEEWFQLVTREGRPTGRATRRQCHGNPALIHLVLHCHVIDRQGRLLLQKRAAVKDTNPGLWDTSVGGHVMAGEPLGAALLREAREELGLDAAAAVPLYSYLREGSFESEFAECFLLRTGQPVQPEPSEIDEVGWFTPAEVEGLVGSGRLTPMFEEEWPRLRSVLAGQDAAEGGDLRYRSATS
jgi:isopentenyl-diphosphate delta-isomerase type 1